MLNNYGITIATVFHSEDEFQFADGDVGVVSRVGIQKQTSASVWGYLNDNWTLEKVGGIFN